jgi:hypothetical protein
MPFSLVFHLNLLVERHVQIFHVLLSLEQVFGQHSHVVLVEAEALQLLELTKNLVGKLSDAAVCDL